MTSDFTRLTPDEICAEFYQKAVAQDDLVHPIAPGPLTQVTESHGEFDYPMYLGKVAGILRRARALGGGKSDGEAIDYRYEVTHPDGGIVEVDAFDALPAAAIDWEATAVDELGNEAPAGFLPPQQQGLEEALRGGREMVRHGKTSWLVSPATREYICGKSAE